MLRTSVLTIATTVLIAASLPAQPPSGTAIPGMGALPLGPSRPLQLLNLDQQRELIETLVQSLNDSDPMTKSYASAALLKIGEPAIPAMLPALESPNLPLKREVVKIIYLMGDLDVQRKATMLALTKELRATDDAEFRRSAVMAINNLAPMARVALPPPKKDKK
ncbi:MAG TPA: HEAT repeat domain-containing protein [Gemmataceae bacterium]|jgi:HEAT repeat protein|nr:HEAT repeat domain-containing protein [Gemmataceae bacterium]